MQGLEWSVIDLTLKQFQLPWTHEWQGSKFDYVLSMVEDEDDGALVDLAAHLGYDHGQTTPRVEPSFWRANTFRLFISHLATHKQEASDLQVALERHGISAFIAHRDIEPTKEWQDEILLALSTADALAALLHEGFHKSYWTDQEVGFAMGREILVLSVALGERPYGFIGGQQALHGHGVDAKALAIELRDVFIDHKLTSRSMAIATAHAFAASDSFAEAKRLLGTLQKLKYSDRRMVDVIRSAVATNRQVSESWGVPEGVDALVKGWGYEDL